MSMFGEAKIDQLNCAIAHNSRTIAEEDLFKFKVLKRCIDYFRANSNDGSNGYG